MKKITLLLMMTGLLISTSLTAQTFFTASMNGGDTYSSETSRFAGYTWSGVGNHVFNNTNSASITLDIAGYDEATVGPELYIRFSRVGFGSAPLGWGSDNSTDLLTLSASDFTAGAATVTVAIPNGTTPIAQTTGYVEGYNYVLQIVGDNDPEAYINYVVKIEETIVLSTKEYKNKLESSFYSSSKDALVLNNNVIGNYRIYDLTGRTILKGKVSNEVGVSVLKPGLYIIATDQGSLKFIK